MDDLARFLLDRICEEEALAAEDQATYKTFPFFTWLATSREVRGVRIEYGPQRHHLREHEEEMLQHATPEAVLADCSSRRAVIEACRSALTFGAVPGMESARVLAHNTLQALADRYPGAPQMPKQP